MREVCTGKRPQPRRRSTGHEVDERKPGFPTEPVPVSSYVGSSKDLKDLKEVEEARLDVVLASAIFICPAACNSRCLQRERERLAIYCQTTRAEKHPRYHWLFGNKLAISLSGAHGLHILPDTPPPGRACEPRSDR